MRNKKMMIEKDEKVERRACLKIDFKWHVDPMNSNVCHCYTHITKTNCKMDMYIDGYGIRNKFLKPIQKKKQNIFIHCTKQREREKS